MPFRFNALTGVFDLVTPLVPGTGDVIGPASATDKAIARYDGPTGLLIQDSPGTLVQDSGAIQASGFLTERSVTTAITIPSTYSWIAPELEIELTGSIEVEVDAELIII